MSEGIRSGMQATGGWDDDKASEFNLAMSKVARMIESPVDSLRAAIPKLERLARVDGSVYIKKIYLKRGKDVLYIMWQSYRW